MPGHGALNVLHIVEYGIMVAALFLILLGTFVKMWFRRILDEFVVLLPLLIVSIRLLFPI